MKIEKSASGWGPTKNKIFAFLLYRPRELRIPYSLEEHERSETNTEINRTTSQMNEPIARSPELISLETG